MTTTINAKEITLDISKRPEKEARLTFSVNEANTKITLNITANGTPVSLDEQYVQFVMKMPDGSVHKSSKVSMHGTLSRIELPMTLANIPPGETDVAYAEISDGDGLFEPITSKVSTNRVHVTVLDAKKG